MNLIRSALAVLIPLCWIPAASAADWEVVAPPELGFSVELPRPVQSRSNNQDPQLFAYEDEFLALIGEDAVAAVIAMQFRLSALEGRSAEDALHLVTETYTGTCGGTAEEREIDVDSGYAVSILRQCDEEGISYRTLAWLDGVILYRVVVAGPEADVTSADADRVISSFKLVK